jgi:hypothetical protein
MEAEPMEAGVAADELRRVELTDAAANLLRQLTGQHGPLMFHQSGGCCDGSSPMCFPDGEFLTGDADILLGELAVPGLDRPMGVRWRQALRSCLVSCKGEDSVQVPGVPR